MRTIKVDYYEDFGDFLREEYDGKLTPFLLNNFFPYMIHVKNTWSLDKASYNCFLIMEDMIFDYFINRMKGDETFRISTKNLKTDIGNWLEHSFKLELN